MELTSKSSVLPINSKIDFGVDEGRDPHPLFDSSWYLERNPHVATSGNNPLVHYLKHGAAEGRDPHPLFNTAYYLTMYSDVANAGVNPLVHYILHGGREGRNPHPLFDGARYAAKYPHLNAEGSNPLDHYLRQGASGAIDPHPLFDTALYLLLYPSVTAENVAALYHYVRFGGSHGWRPHSIFDAVWYLRHYPEVAATGLDPLTHYMLRGAREGKNPHPLFDTAFYRERNPDIGSMNPLEHYFTVGASQKRDPHPLFHAAWYLERNADVARAGRNPLVHFIWSGATDRRNPHPFFDTEYYLSQKPITLAHGMDPLAHYLEIGAAEGLNPNPLFDTSYYLRQNPDVVEQKLNPLVHYALAGRVQGHAPHPGFAAAFEPALVEMALPPLGDVFRFRKLELEMKLLAYQPLISVLIATFDPPLEYLRLALDSVLSQLYANWQLCVHDDGSSSQEVLQVLDEYRTKDKRIQIQKSSIHQGISQATNAALAMACGEFVALLNHDGEILPDALAAIALALNADCKLDVLYADDTYVNEDGSMYAGRLLAVRREAALAVGGCDSHFEGCHDYELMLRICERSGRIHHLARVLSHSRRRAESSFNERQKAVVNARSKRQRPVLRDHAPRVSIFVHETSDAQAIRDTVRSILECTCYSDFEIHEEGYDGLELPGWPFASAQSEYIVRISAGLQVDSPRWLDDLLVYAEMEDVGFVCPLILDPEGNEVETVSDGCNMISKIKLRGLGPPGPYLSLRYRMTDWSLRAEAAGLRRIHIPWAVLRSTCTTPSDSLIPPFDRAIYEETWGAAFSSNP